jgi:ankyrin repeat protein
MVIPRFANLRRVAACAIVVAMLSGCAGLPSGNGPIDADALLNAIVADEVEYVAAAVKTGRAHVNQRIPAPVYMEGTPLITIAARAGSVGVVRFLIAAGADLNALTPAGETALMLACYFGADSDETASKVSERHERIVRLLAEAGATLENEPNYYGPEIRDVNTPLMMAAMQGNRSSAVLLLRAGANARVRTYRGFTAAQLAAKYDGKSIVPMLRCAEMLRPGEKFAQRCEVAAR